MTDTQFKDARQIAEGGACRPGSFVQFGAGEPQRVEASGAPTWIARGANFVVAASRVEDGAEIVQQDIPDESMLLVPPGLSVTVEAEGQIEQIAEEALAILPPGSARIAAQGAGMLVRVFSSAATQMAALACNAEASRDVADVAPLAYWPTPPGGFRLRVYRLRDHAEDVGFGRLFRSTNLMVNLFEPSTAPRDPSKLSPHDHADFEQGSLTLEGDFTHHLRTPWGRDSRQWRGDQRIDCSGCSLVVIPPRMIHTTSWSTTGARLVDIFAPPREDFSRQPRWVRNAADYPAPEHIAAAIE